MPITHAYKVAGNTIGLSVANTSHAAVTITAADPSANGLLCCNTSTAGMMYVNTASGQAPGADPPTAAAATIPGDGTAGSFPVISYNERVIAGVRFPLSVTAICSIAGPTLLTVTPVIIL